MGWDLAWREEDSDEIQEKSIPCLNLLFVSLAEGSFLWLWGPFMEERIP